MLSVTILGNAFALLMARTREMGHHSRHNQGGERRKVARPGRVLHCFFSEAQALRKMQEVKGCVQDESALGRASLPMPLSPPVKDYL
mmetsp:Transcript_3659/g.6971  ORF Transcript_3659/g.6971 Transcript_3659/m.6971 type:complete len:87 (-) Transcript_3659:749-1009(-)